MSFGEAIRNLLSGVKVISWLYFLHIFLFYLNPNACILKDLKVCRIKNTMALLNQIIKYLQNLGIIERTCNFQVKRLTDKDQFSINIITFI